MSDLSSPNAIGSGGAGNTTGYYDSHHNGFSATNGGGSTESILYDSITTISQAQSSLYTPPLVSSLGKLLRPYTTAHIFAFFFKSQSVSDYYIMHDSIHHRF